MRAIKYPLTFWIVGLVLACASVAGTGLVLASRQDGRESRMPKSASADNWVVTCFGHADVEGGVATLCPLQAGRVEQVCVHENDEVRAGATLLQLDARPAEHLVRQARAD